VTLLDRSIKPFQLSKGSLTFLTQSGTLQAQYLSSHSHLNDWNQYAGQESHLRYFFQSLALNKLGHCLMVSQIINDTNIFNFLGTNISNLGKKALENIQINIA
jgi:hypothetical protein